MKSLLCLLISLLMVSGVHAQAMTPEEGSVELEQKGPKKAAKIDPSKPMVLILGDSISMGYTGTVRKELAGKANVLHNPGNSGGTTKTLENIDKWLAMQEWDVIHFNLGLHDLKRVKAPGSSESSDDPNDPYQADLETYSKNLEVIVKKMQAIGAQLVFATTTPFPSGVSPHRDPEDAPKYNEAALKIMEKYNIPVNDLYGLILPQLEEVQKPQNVHFKKGGSVQMGKQVAEHIEKHL